MERRFPLYATVESQHIPQSPADLARLFEEHQSRVYRAAYRVTGNAPDAEDVLQTVFLRLIRREYTGNPMDNPESYLYRAAINASLDVLRSRQSARSVPLEDFIGIQTNESKAQGSGPVSLEVQMWLRQALTKLSPRPAEMFILRYLEGYDNREIAQMLKTSQAVVAVTLFRARASLQKEFRASSERTV